MLIEDRFKTYVTEGTYIFFDLDGSKVPYMVTNVEEEAHFVISIEDVINKRESDLLAGQEIWVPLATVKSRHQLSPKNIKDKWSEYLLHDNGSGTAYPILRTEEYPQQLMAVIQIANREVLVPLSDQLITEISKEEKTIFMDIPEGLLEL